MIELREEDYIPLESFGLKWRWTDSRYNSLPADVLSTIRPLSPAKAREVHWQTLTYISDGIFVSGRYQLVDKVETGQEDRQRVSDWLRSYMPDPGEDIIVSWGSGDAVSTIASVFCGYWDDFCYPSSDDVIIAPLSGEWVLAYWHEETLFWAALPKTAC